MEEEKQYTAYAMTKMFPNLRVGTINARFKSKYAKERWGVEHGKWPDGKLKRYVPESMLYLWLEDRTYQGRPKVRED